MGKVEIPATRKSFVINSEHADMIVNDLMQGDYEALGRIFTDLVNLNVNGDLSITETDCDNKAERTARRLLRSDSEHYIAHYKARSETNRDNRTSGHQPSREELLDYARAKGYDQQIVIEWGMKQAQQDWCDRNGEPIKYWKKTLDSYMQAVNRKKIDDMTKGFRNR